MKQHVSRDPIPLIHLLSRQQKQGCAHRLPALAYLPDLMGLNRLLQSHWGLYGKIGPPPQKSSSSSSSSSHPVRVESLHPPGGWERKNHHLGFSHGDARGWGSREGRGRGAAHGHTRWRWSWVAGLWQVVQKGEHVLPETFAPPSRRPTDDAD